MAQVILDFSNNSGTELNLIFTISDVQNHDGSYTVTGASNTPSTSSTISANGTSSTVNITGVTPTGVDGSDNELFVGDGVAVFDLGGVTLTTDGTVAGATYVGSSVAYNGELNLFYTGSTTLLGVATLSPNSFGIDTNPVTYLTCTSEILIDASGKETVIDPACFLEGALIRTPDGDRPVETLRPGDLLVTVAGQAKRIDWIGRRRLAAQFCDPLRCWPIRIRAHALGENQPSRDLLVSPDHAMLVDEVLIHAGALVNGVSILRESAPPPAFTYYHLELDEHALILAENAATESFIDNADRMGFDNWEEHEALYPEGKPMRELDIPRAKAARQVPMRLRAVLAQRAANLYGRAAAA